MTDPSIFLPPAQGNLVRSWLRSLTRSLEEGSTRLGPIARAELLGLYARTDPTLLQGEVWDRLIESLQDLDYSNASERSRTQSANALVETLRERAADCSSRFSTLVDWYESNNSSPSPLASDEVIQLVDDVDALSRLCIAMSWIVDRGQPIEAMAARDALDRSMVLIEHIGRRADCLTPAQERLEALLSTVDESVLSSDPWVSILQHQAIGDLRPFAATVRRSAVWIAHADAHVFWTIAAAEETSLDDEGGAFSLVAELRGLADRSAGRGADRDGQSVAEVAGRILLQRPVLAAADTGRTSASLSLFWRSQAEANSSTPEQEARCTIDKGAGEFLVRFFRAGALDRTLNGVSVNWLGVPATVDAGVARFNISKFHDQMGAAELARHFADNVTVLWVGGTPWDCARYEVSGA